MIVHGQAPGQKYKNDVKMKEADFMNINQDNNTRELDLKEAETVSGGKVRYKEILKYLTEEQKKELEELEKRVANR